MKIKYLSLYLIVTMLLFGLLFASGCQIMYLIDKIDPDYDERGNVDLDVTNQLSSEEEKSLDEVIAVAEKELKE